MAPRIFLDANVILDFTLKRPQYELSKTLFGQAVSGQIIAYITPAIVHIVGYWLTKSYGVKNAKEILVLLLNDVRVIDIGHDITLMALHSKMNDIEDALQYYTALHHKLDCFVSRDKGMVKNALPSLPVFTPQEFLNGLK